MIPKIIHWCWLSDEPLPANLQRYVDHWKDILPDYEVWLWDFKRFDKSSSIWVSQAFDNKKYAFAADYIRLYALFHYGGIYLDSDVEVLKSYNPFLGLPTMACCEYGSRNLEMATIGVEKGAKWIGDCLNVYKENKFVREDGTFNMIPLPMVIKQILQEKGYKLVDITDESMKENKRFSADEIPVLPYDFFSPKSFDDNKVYCTERTVSIHQFAGTWVNKKDLKWYRLKAKIKKMFHLK